MIYNRSQQAACGRGRGRVSSDTRVGQSGHYHHVHHRQSTHHLCHHCHFC